MLTRIPLLLTALALVLAGPAAAAEQIETPASHAILVDFATGEVLFQKNGAAIMPPASMSKLMTAELVFARLKQGELGLADTFRVSEKAWRQEGSRMFLDLNSEVAVGDLLQGIIVQSGNDACIVVAEGIAGSEARFAELMTERARALGLTGSTFANATGLPDPGQMMTAEDLARLAAHIIRSYPEYVPLYAQREFTWNKIRQANRNPLLGKYPGADGMKTGRTSVSGFGLVATAAREGRRLILVVNGLGSEAEREAEAARLLDIGFREYKRYELLRPGTPVAMAAVHAGEVDQVALTVAAPVSLTLSRAMRDRITVRVAYDGPLLAPVEAGAPVGTLTVEAPGLEPVTVPVVAAASVAEQGLIPRMLDAAGELFGGLL